MIEEKKLLTCDCETQRSERHCSIIRLSKIEYLDSVTLSSSSLWGLELGIEIKDEMVYNGARDNCIYRENGRFWEENMLGNHIHL